MKYFVVSDVHGFFTELVTALNEAGFNTDDENHRLIVCGDLMDRGSEAVKVQYYIYDLWKRNKAILIRGNHEDLIYELITGFSSLEVCDNNTELQQCYMGYLRNSYHWSNGTVQTLMQLTDSSLHDLVVDLTDGGWKVRKTPLIKTLIPSMVDYFETKHYIFVHGWIPTATRLHKLDRRLPIYDEDWRNADKKRWQDARWSNGMEMAHDYGIKEPNKTIVCGHYHCSWGWAYLSGEKIPELPDKKSPIFQKAFSPYREDGIIAIDACTAYSGKINCIVIED